MSTIHIIKIRNVDDAIWNCVRENIYLIVLLVALLFGDLVVYQIHINSEKYRTSFKHIQL